MMSACRASSPACHWRGEVRESLPSSYYRERPVLASGPLAGYPRWYQSAITLISHTEGRIALDNVSGFVAAFQQISVLTIGEVAPSPLCSGWD